LIGVLLTTGAFAQLSPFPKVNYFRETFQKTQTKVELKDPVRLKDYVHDDKLELSLKDYLGLVMANNTGIQLQMLSVETPKNAIQRAFSAWDPNLQASFSSTRTKTPSNSILEGAATTSQLSQPFQGAYSQTLDTGTNYFVTYGATKITSNSSFNSYNPSLTSNLQVRFSQPLLRNRGRYVNRLNLMVARSNYRISDYQLRNSLITNISTAENAYWQVILARENIKVAEGARKVAQALMDYTQKQLDLGALSPLDIFQTRQQLAQTELQLAQAQFNLKLAEDALRNQLAVDLDPDIRKLPLVLTEIVELPNADSVSYDYEASVEKAINNRPDLKAAGQRLDVDDLQITQAKNGLLPNLSLTGNYSTQGRGGVFTQRTNVFNDGVPSSVVNVLPGGFGDALTQMFGFGYPIYSFGLTLNLPIKSHTAAMDLADAMVRKKTDALTLRNSQETVRLNVLNAITNLEGSKEQLKLAKTVRELSQANLDAMNKKYELGTEIIPNVTRAAQDLTSAEFNLVQQQINLRRSILTLLTQTGELLDERGIVIQ
jgi:outer membrane protein TolC